MSTDVSVVGTGAMGSAIARALLASGRSVTVWNRTPDRADGIVDAGARRAATAGEAIAASPAALLVLWDYASTDTVLRTPEVEGAARGRTLIQLARGTPAEAEATGAWAQAHAATYLDGFPWFFADEMGAPGNGSVYSGERTTFDEHRPMLECFSKATHVGQLSGAANACLIASFPVFNATLLAFLQGAAVAEARGITPTAFAAVLQDLLPVLGALVTDGAERIAGEKPDAPPMITVEDLAGMGRDLIDECGDSGVAATFAAQLDHHFDAAMRGGLEHRDIAAMYPMFRRSGSPAAAGASRAASEDGTATASEG